MYTNTKCKHPLEYHFFKIDGILYLNLNPISQSQSEDARQDKENSGLQQCPEKTNLCYFLSQSIRV